MRFTNDQDLPDALHQALKWNDYNSGGEQFDISATKLIDSPLIAQHWREHSRDVVEDSATRLYAFMGSGIHSRFEAANASNANVMLEKRFLWDFAHPIEGNDPLTVSAQIDTYDFKTKTLADLKTVSAWKLVMKDYDSFEKQLNLGAYLMKQNGFEVDALQVYALCRDWSKARQNESNYPMQPIQVVDIPLWTEDEQLAYITERLELHFGEGEKSCSDKEMWKKDGSYAVKDVKKKRALRVLPTREKAENWISSQGLEGKSGISIEERPASYMRCETYCAFGSMGVCAQFNNRKEEEDVR